jgi:hypothetical protein
MGKKRIGDSSGVFCMGWGVRSFWHCLGLADWLYDMICHCEGNNCIIFYECNSPHLYMVFIPPGFACGSVKLNDFIYPCAVEAARKRPN